MKREKKTILCSNILIAKGGVILAIVFVIVAGVWYNKQSHSNGVMTMSEEVTQAPVVTIEKGMEAKSQEQLYCYVCGAVKKPGVYAFSEGARLNEVINLAGGFTQDAAENYLNLALQVSDEEKVYIPTKKEIQRQGNQVDTGLDLQENTLQKENSSVEDKLNINTADIDKLTSLPGIGTNKAEKIVAYREEHGAFQGIEEIKNVEGIKEGVFQKVKDLISIQ